MNEQVEKQLLQSTARSFALTIELMPSRLRSVLRRTYLLARATDTIADVSPASVEVRTQTLMAIQRALLQTEAVDISPFRSTTLRSEEQSLLDNLSGLLSAHQQNADQPTGQLSTEVLQHILTGQLFDLSHFAEATHKPISLSSQEQLEQYTFWVAGSVGEYWTKLCINDWPGFTRVNEPMHLISLGKRFGQALQLTNILRDAFQDWEQGRCYLPPLPDSQGQEVDQPDHLEAKVRFYQTQADNAFVAAIQYQLALKPFRLRLAVGLPILIGLATMKLVEENLPDSSHPRNKVSRSLVYSLLRQAPFWASSHRLFLRKCHELARPHMRQAMNFEQAID
ncbi:MAG: phytoene/squalene synthase family protein [Verrucomicrobiales bacterium]